MKTKTKTLLITMCAIMLVAATVFGTMAYLTSKTGPVTNTFTIGKVAITLDEAKVNPDGTPVEGATERVTGNEYHLVPGHSYLKDPTVHVVEGSESSWIFVEVVNGIKALEATDADYKNIAAQIEANGWKALGDDYPGVYYMDYTKEQDVKDLKVFENFKIADNANDNPAWDERISDVTINAYAIQKEGLNVTQAWAALTDTSV